MEFILGAVFGGLITTLVVPPAVSRTAQRMARDAVRKLIDSRKDESES